jgi:hypothetical protein
MIAHVDVQIPDLGARDRRCVVEVDIVKVSEAEQVVVDGLLRVLRSSPRSPTTFSFTAIRSLSCAEKTPLRFQAHAR